MSDEFMEISKEDIESIELSLKLNADYKLKDTKFNVKSFKKAKDIVIIQYVANVENELVFHTKEENGKYFISSTFDLFKEAILTGNFSRDVFQSVSEYFHNVIENEDKDFTEEKTELINFLVLTEDYEEEKLLKDLDPAKIREDYKKDYDKIYSDESLNRVQKSLALKELVHMSICQVVDDIDLFFTRPFDLTPEENAEKNRQEAKALENELQLG
ncbi:MAG: hypothetical protein IJL02_00880 [Methanobrevibacter sp.]|uniref:hypothetical protein n=1 Tax=Methanobrevibacter sp. TaxID=66852 RepID=UPI0025D6B4F7|nr:hypothetical protein [Methanobrevibacter sp.]MBQ6098402.1 hypothetical protein [Methanobrevibacter sp.]